MLHEAIERRKRNLSVRSIHTDQMCILSEGTRIQIYRSSIQQFVEKRQNWDAEKNMEKECIRSESFGSHNIDFSGLRHLSSEIMEQRFEADGYAKNGKKKVHLLCVPLWI